MIRRLALFIALGCIIAIAPLRAHHGFMAEFDINKPIKATGTVTKVEWMNPHVWFYVDVKDEAGTVQNWAFELAGPNGLMRLGWTQRSMKIGDTVTVEASCAKDGSPRANARTVLLAATGQRLFAGSSESAPGQGNDAGGAVK
jgi:hypothetical protein